MKPLGKIIPLDKSLDGARILARHFLSTGTPLERYVREFSPEGKHVRLARSLDPADTGTWWRIFDLRVEAVLEEKRLPQLERTAAPAHREEPPPVEDYT